MKKLCSKTLKTLIEQTKYISQQTSRKKLFVLYLVYTLTLTKLKYFTPYTIKLHCYRGDVLSGEQQIITTKKLLERFGRSTYISIYLIENMDQKINFYDSDEIKIRFTDHSQYFGIYLLIFAFKFVIQEHGGKRRLKAICVVKSKVVQLQRKYKTRKFQNLIKIRFLRDIH